MSLLDQMRGGLIVSVQAWAESAIDDPHVIAAMARAAQDNGAVAVRVQGVDNVVAVRRRVTIPIVGLIKRHYPGFQPYITPTLEEVRALIDCGVEIVAIDATLREHPNGATLDAMLDAVHGSGRMAMADCAGVEEAALAARSGAEIVATTLRGYTDETAGRVLPALDLVAELRARFDATDSARAFLVCEGGIRQPQQVRAALHTGADAVVVGTAITNVDWLVREFAGSADTARNR